MFKQKALCGIMACKGNNSSDLAKALTNKCLELIMAEINKTEMQESIRVKLVNPLMLMIYKQLYPYIFTFIIVMFLMFVMIIILLIFFLTYLRK